jgi:predicted kinase
MFLVAGAPRSGKSTIARMIARELRMSYFPVDALVSSLGTLHPELGITHLTSNPSAVGRVLSPMLGWKARECTRVAS